MMSKAFELKLDEKLILLTDLILSFYGSSEKLVLYRENTNCLPPASFLSPVYLAFHTIYGKRVYKARIEFT